MIEVVAGAAEPVELGAGLLQRAAVGRAAILLERAVAHALVFARDRQHQVVHRRHFSVRGELLALVRLTGGEQLDEPDEDLFAVAPAQGQGELREERAVLDADVVPRAGQLERQVTLAGGQPGQRRRQSHRPGGRGRQRLAQQVHHRRRQHVHAEQAEVEARAGPAPPAAARPRSAWASPARYRSRRGRRGPARGGRPPRRNRAACSRASAARRPRHIAPARPRRPTAGRRAAPRD